MSGLIMAAQLLMSLAILIILHELGHFLAARAFGIRVEKFFLFFDAWGFKLFSIKRGDTEIGIGWLPLGGYVKIAGMIDESMDKEQMALPPKPDEFRSKPAWQRLIVMLAGVTVNVVLGVLIFTCIILKNGQSYTSMADYKDGIVPGSALASIGVKPGDQILRIGKKPVVKTSDLNSTELIYGNIQLRLRRQGRDTSVFVPKNFIEVFFKFSQKEELFTPRIISQLDSVLQGSHADLAGFKKGDYVLGVNGQSVTYWDQFQAVMKSSKGKNLLCRITRNGQEMDLHATTDAAGKIGVIPRLPKIAVTREKFSVFGSLGLGSRKAFGIIGDNAVAIGKVARREISPQTMSGPIGIAKFFGSEFDWLRFWTLTGMLSMALAFINVLPIPALDGGHAMFLIIEIIRGRPLSDKVLENAQIVGFFIVMGLLVFQFGNDILKLFTKQ